MKNMMMASLAVFLMFVPILGFGENRQEVMERGPHGLINWSAGVIEAIGIGVPPESSRGTPPAQPMAQRAAKLDAYRNLLKLIRNVRVNSSIRVKDYAGENDVIMTRVEGLVRGSQLVDKVSLSEDTVKVTLRMSLYGDFARVVLPRDIRDIKPVKPLPDPEGAALSSGFSKEKAKAAEEINTISKVYTGLVVDASGLNAKPAMAPAILDENHKEVYGPAFVSREYAIRQGLSGYAGQLEKAKKNGRVAGKPLMVKGLKTVGPGQCNIVISNADASMLRRARENLAFLRQCRVMIVVD